MKKLLLIIVLLASTIWLQAQPYDTRPAILNTISSPGFYIDPATSNIWLYKGSGNWINLGSRRNMQFSIDSLSALGYKRVEVDNLLSAKVDKITGKGLSEADVTSAEKTAITHSNRAALDLVSGTNTGDQNIAAITHANRTALDLVSGLNTGDNQVNSLYSGLASSKINVSEKAQVNGVATLDDNAKVPLSQMNDAILGSVRYQGTWSAVSNIPAIPTATTANKGYYYVASDEATYSGTLFKVKDWIISNGSVWQKVDNNNLIGSVFGRVGNVLANAGDYTTDQVTEGTNKYYTEGRVSANASVVANTAKVTNATHTGDVTGSTALILATVNTTIGTYNNVTVNAKGLVTGASNAAYLTTITSGQVTGALGYTPLATRTFGTIANSATGDYLPIGGGILTGAYSTAGNALEIKYSQDVGGVALLLSTTHAANSDRYFIKTTISNGSVPFWVKHNGDINAGNATFSGSVTATGGNSTQWNTTYGWGDWHHTTLSGYGITDALPTRTFGTAANSATTDFAPSSTVSNATHTGDVTGSTALILATVNTTIGTYNNVTVNAKGLVTGASNAAYLTSYTETDPNIYAWAKASVKPAYTYTEITGTPALNYLPLTGGTLTGAYNTTGNALEVKYTQDVGGVALLLSTTHAVNSDRYFINTQVAGGLNPFWVKHNGDINAGNATFSGSVTATGAILKNTGSSAGIDIIDDRALYGSEQRSGILFRGRWYSGALTDIGNLSSIVGTGRANGWHDGGMAFNCAVGNVLTEKMRLTSAGDLSVSGSVTAAAFKMPGGTSAQYLLADGSVTTTAGAVYKGQVNGSTGSGLADGTGTTGWYYACATAGTHNYGSGNITLAVGDQLYYNGTIWIWVPGAGSYTLPIAAASVLGGVKPSTSVAVDGSGVMSVSTAYDATGTASGLLSTHNSTYNHANIANGQTAYGWGDWRHATLSGYGITDALPYRTFGTAANNATGDFEPTLGNPSTTGYVLSSTTSGGRSWVTPQSGPAGVTGAQGAQGIQGLTGSQGATGAAGLTTSVNGIAQIGGNVTLSKSDLSLGNVDNTADASKVVASAAKLTTPRTINGVAFDGTADIVVAAQPIVPLDASVEYTTSSTLVYGTNNQTTITGTDIYYAAKGGHALMMFAGNFDSTVLNQGFTLMFNVDGVNEKTVYSSVYGSRIVVSFQHLKVVNPGSVYHIKVAWNATTNIYTSNNTLTIIDLP